MKLYLSLAITALFFSIFALMPSQAKAGDYYVSGCEWSLPAPESPIGARYIDGWTITGNLSGVWQVLPNQCHVLPEEIDLDETEEGVRIGPWKQAYYDSKRGINLMSASASKDSYIEHIKRGVDNGPLCTRTGFSPNTANEREMVCSPRMFLTQNPNGTFHEHISPITTPFNPQTTGAGQEGTITFNAAYAGLNGIGIRQANLRQGARSAGDHNVHNLGLTTPRPYAAGLFSNSTNLGLRAMFYGFNNTASFRLSQNRQARGTCLVSNAPIDVITYGTPSNACYFSTTGDNYYWDIGLDAGHSTSETNSGTINQNSAELTPEIGLKLRCESNPCSNNFAGVVNTNAPGTTVAFPQYYAVRLNMYASRMRLVDTTNPVIANTITGRLAPGASSRLNPLGPGTHGVNDVAVADPASSGMRNITFQMLRRNGTAVPGGSGIDAVAAGQCALGDLKGDPAGNIGVSAEGHIVSSRLRPCPDTLAVSGFSYNMTSANGWESTDDGTPYRMQLVAHDVSNNPVSTSWNVWYDPERPTINFCGPTNGERIESDIPSPQNRQTFPGQGTVTWARRQVTVGFCAGDNDRIAETHVQFRTRTPGGGWSGWANVPGCTQPAQALGVREHATECRLDTSTFAEGTQVEFRKYAADGAGNLLNNTSFSINSSIYVDNTAPRVDLKNDDFFRGSVPTTEHRITPAPDTRKWTNTARTSFVASVQNGNYSTPITQVTHVYWAGPSCSASDQNGSGIATNAGSVENLSTPIPAAGNRDREFNLNNKVCAQDQGEHKARVWAVDALGNSSGPVSGTRSNGGTEIRAWTSAPAGADSGSGGTTPTDAPYFYDDVDPDQPGEHAPAVYPETSVPGGWVVQWQNPSNFGPEGAGSPTVSQMRGLRISWANDGEKIIRSNDGQTSTGTNYGPSRPSEGVRRIGTSGTEGLYCTERGVACTEGKLYVDKSSVPTSGVIPYVVKAEDWAGNVSKPYTINAMYDSGEGCVLN